MADAASPDDHRLAGELATEAGKLLIDPGADAAELKAEGDRRSNALLMERLADLFPADAILSEEGKDEQGAGGTSRLDADRVWVVDPLDGTREFSEPPRGDWAVHVALVVDGAP